MRVLIPRQMINVLQMIKFGLHLHSKLSYTVSFDVMSGDEFVGSMTFGLFCDEVPNTCRNFLNFVNSEPPSSYEGTVVHRVQQGLAVYSGDVERGDGRGGYSIFGKYFLGESFRQKFIRGSIAMTNWGPNSNNCQFMIGLQSAPWMDNQVVTFGVLFEGDEVLERIERAKVDFNGKPLQPIKFLNWSSKIEE